MTRAALLAGYLATAAAAVFPVNADEGGQCSHFTWNVAHEVAVMGQTPQGAIAATQLSGKTPVLRPDRAYELKLIPQAQVRYSVPPKKPQRSASTRGGLVKFRVSTGGVYRISLSSGAWIDVVDGGQFIKSNDFEGSHDCARLHKIVEFELPADRDLLLQLSDSGESSVLVAITKDQPAK